MKILIVEDEKKTTAFLSRGLSENGFVVEVATRGDVGLEMARRGDVDLVILDVMLPGKDGWSVLTELRRDGIQTPVLFLTARDAVDDRVKGLELGGDDYLVKPFAFAELLARIRSLLRRSPLHPSELLHVADLELDLVRRKAARGSQRLELTPKEFALLALLAQRQGEVVSRAQIVQEVWDLPSAGDSNVVDVHVRRLRAKVDGPFERKLIRTVRGVGYMLGEQSSN
jgi:two-component system copper resistance phosphate regulon response regulator CusR